ncbi:Na+/H+ antiporter subunit E [Parapedobacter sp. GCM10030251]|uniref:Na+/H+ antiporter subunit E n=1 Tax=Parapedobacter sp. GCM10030251 TaxID=3273419 RepID=UPI003611C654
MVKQFLMNLLLAFIWVALTGVLYYTNFLFGFAIGFFLMWLMNRNESDHRYFTRVPKIIGFFLYFLYEMIKANLQVAYDMVTPKFFMKPGIVKYPMNAKSDVEINLLSTVISLTPGTLILDVSEDRKVLYIHVMYLKDKEQFIQQIKDGFERRLLEILR